MTGSVREKEFGFRDIEERVRKIMVEQSTAEESAALRLASRLLKRPVTLPSSLAEAAALLEELEAAGYTLAIVSIPLAHDVFPSTSLNCVFVGLPDSSVVAYKRVEVDRERVWASPTMTYNHETGGESQ